MAPTIKTTGELTKNQEWSGSVGQQKKPKTKTESILQTAKDTAIGMPEAVVSGASGIGGFLGGLVGQAGATLYDIWKSGGRNISSPADVLRSAGSRSDVKDKVAGLLTHEPTTQFAQAATDVASAPFTAALGGVEWAAKKAAPDDPNLQKGIMFVAELALAKGIKPATGYIKRVIAAKKPLKIETMIKFVEENAPPEVVAEMRAGLDKGLFGKKSAEATIKTTAELGKSATRKLDEAQRKLAEIKRVDLEEQKANANANIAEWNKLRESVTAGMAEQGEALLGQPRGGSMLPTQTLPKMAGPINIERIDSPQAVKKFMVDMEDRLTQSRAASGRQHVKWSESEEIAKSMGGAYELGQAFGKTAEDVIADTRKSTRFLAEKIDAIRTLNTTAATDAVKKMKEWRENPTEASEAAAKLAYNRAALIQYETGMAKTESARSLAIQRKMSKAKDFMLTKNYARVIKELGHKELTPEVMNLIASLDEQNPIATMRFLANARKATTKEKLFEVWINSILANPATHIVNFSSNMLFEAMSPFEKVAGAGIEVIKHPFKTSNRELYFGEAAHSIVGAFHGMREGLNRYAYAMKEGVTKSGVSKFEETGISPNKAIKGVKGEVIRIPTKELMANDDFWKAIIYSDDIYAQAYRSATKEGLRGDVRKAKMAELIANPSESMIAAANHAAQVRTFQAELGKLGKDFMRMRSRPGAVGTAMNFVFPFVRTPVNVVKEGLKRTPFGAITGKGLTRAEHSMRLGQATAAAATAALVAKLVADGVITGAAPDTRAERETLYNTGWRPYSVKINGTYYGYGRLEPLATSVGTVADSYAVFDKMKKGEWPKVVAKIGTAFRNNITNKTFLTGMTDLINATTDPNRYGENFIKRLSTSLVPGSGLLGATAKAIDPEIKEAKSIIDWYKARLPLLSKQVPAKLNVMGAPQKTGGTALSRFLSPVSVSKEANDPVYAELARLGINLSPMSPTSGGKKMTDEAARKMNEEAGPEIKAAVSKLMASPLYLKQSNENKKRMLRSWITKTRAYQRGLFLLREK